MILQRLFIMSTGKLVMDHFYYFRVCTKVVEQGISVVNLIELLKLCVFSDML